MICENDTIASMLQLCLINNTIWILERAAFKNKTKKNPQDHDEKCEKGEKIIEIEKNASLTKTANLKNTAPLTKTAHKRIRTK